MDGPITIEQFFADFFRERTVAWKQRLEIHQLYWRRFFQADCPHASGRGTVERSEAEQIVSISPAPVGKWVVTTGFSFYRSRYLARPSGSSWLIHEVNTECIHCRPVGISADCHYCGGSGWLNLQDRANLKWPKRKSSPITTAAPEPPPIRDPAIEQFMATLFRERTASLKKELPIEEDFAKHFYSPDFDLTVHVPSVQSSEAEHIVSIVPHESGPRVITAGDFLGLRYHLRPSDGGWLIWQVDTECPLCLNQGHRADCFWCGGTIWDHKSRKPSPSHPESPGEHSPPANPRS